METYRLSPLGLDDKYHSVMRLSDMACIPFDPMNTDYRQFKQDVLDGATLEDVDGNAMTQKDAEAFIATLP